MSAAQYEVLKCDECGRKLGYVHISVKIYPPETLIHLKMGGPIKKIRKSAFCSECFHRLKRNQ